MNISKDPATDVLTISGKIEIGEVNTLRVALLEYLSSGSEMVLDLGGADGCDTAGLQALLAAQKDAKTLGKSFRVAAISPGVSAVTAALGLELRYKGGHSH